MARKYGKYRLRGLKSVPDKRNAKNSTLLWMLLLFKDIIFQWSRSESEAIYLRRGVSTKSRSRQADTSMILSSISCDHIRWSIPAVRTDVRETQTPFNSTEMSQWNCSMTLDLSTTPALQPRYKTIMRQYFWKVSVYIVARNREPPDCSGTILHCE